MTNETNETPTPEINPASDDLYEAVDGFVEVIQAIAGDELSKEGAQAIAAKQINKLADTVSFGDIADDLPGDEPLEETSTPDELKHRDEIREHLQGLL